MSLGTTSATEDLFKSSREVCEQWLSEDSIYRILHREGSRLFPDEAFADLFAKTGRNSIPPQIVAVVMVLQRMEGLSDREAVDRCRFDSAVRRGGNARHGDADSVGDSRHVARR